MGRRRGLSMGELDRKHRERMRELVAECPAEDGHDGDLLTPQELIELLRSQRIR